MIIPLRNRSRRSSSAATPQGRPRGFIWIPKQSYDIYGTDIRLIKMYPTIISVLKSLRVPLFMYLNDRAVSWLHKIKFQFQNMRTYCSHVVQLLHGGALLTHLVQLLHGGALLTHVVQLLVKLYCPISRAATVHRNQSGRLGWTLNIPSLSLPVAELLVPM